MAGEENKIAIERSPEYRTIFSNHFRFRFSPSDGRITFSEFMDSPCSELINVMREHIAVSMTWPQIKMLSEFLTAAVEEVEKQVGPIVSLGPTADELRKQSGEIIKAFSVRKKG